MNNANYSIMENKLMEARRNIRSCISINPKMKLDKELNDIDTMIGDTITHVGMCKNGVYDEAFSSRKIYSRKANDQEKEDIQNLYYGALNAGTIDDCEIKDYYAGGIIYWESLGEEDRNKEDIVYNALDDGSGLIDKYIDKIDITDNDEGIIFSYDF